MFLEKKIPFYGKYNSISRIELSEDGFTYQVKRYDNKGKEKKETFEVPKKNKNTDSLINDYYSNVEEFLIKNKNKYTLSKDKKISLKKNFNLNKISKLIKVAKIGLTLSTLLIIFTSLTASSILLYYIGFVILIPSSTGLFVLNDIAKEVKLKNFIGDYEAFEDSLNEYKLKIETKNKKSLTEYNGLNKDKNKGNDLKLKKIRTLESKVA